MIQIKTRSLVGDIGFIEMSSGTNTDRYYAIDIDGMQPNKTYIYTCGSSDNDNYTGTRDYDVRIFATVNGVWTQCNGFRMLLDGAGSRSAIFTTPDNIAINYVLIVSNGRAGYTQLHDSNRAGTYGWFRDISVRETRNGVEFEYDVNDFTFQESDMGESNVSLSLKLPVSVDPGFDKSMYVEYKGERFYLSNTEPQSFKDISSLMYTYNLIFDSERTDLKRRMVRDLAWNGIDTYISQGQVFSTNATLSDFFTLILHNLTDCFGSKWTVDVNPSLSQPNSVKIDVSNSYIWDLLLKTYEYYGVRWKIVSISGGMCIKVGYPADEISHVFEYGGDTGLTKITRELSGTKVVNRLRGVGGTRNLPTNYFTDRYSTFPADPNVIPGSLSFKNLMPKCFRDSVKAHATLVDYVQDDVLVAKNGIIEDGLVANEDIYPSIEGVTVVGKGRIDEIVTCEIPDFDDPEYKGGDSVAGIESKATLLYTVPVASGGTPHPQPDVSHRSYVNSTSVSTSVITSSENTTSVVSETDVFILSETFLVAKLNLQFLDQYDNTVMPKLSTDSYSFTSTKDKKAITIKGSPLVASVSIELRNTTTGATVSTSSMSKADVDSTKDLSFTGLVKGNSYKFILTTVASGTIENWVAGVKVGYLSWSTVAKLTNISNVSGVYKPTFDIWVKDIGFNLSDKATDGTAFYAGTEDGKVAFKTGDLAGYEFTILQIDKQFASTPDTTKTLNSVPSAYKITLIKSDVEYKASGSMLPSKSVHSIAGDKFTFLGIQMPQSYVENAESRLQDYLVEQLNLVKSENPTYTIELFDIFIKENPSIEALIRGGNSITIADPRLINGNISLFINAVTANYRGILPKYTVTVTNKVTVGGSTVQRIQSQIDALYTGQYTAAQSAALSLAALDSRYLRKTIEDAAYQSIEFKKGAVVSHLETDNFRQGQFGGSGGSMYKDENGDTVLEVDNLNIRKKAVFNELVINQIKFQGGIVVYSAANMEVSAADSIGSDFRLYFDTKGNTIHNQFVVNDIIRCQRFSSTVGDSKFYSTRVINIGIDFIDISSTYKQSGCDLNPEMGDQVVQFGNISDTSRQSVVEIDVTNGGKQTFYQGINSYDLTDKNFIDLGMVQVGNDLKNMIRAYGDAYIGDRDLSSYIKFDKAAKSLEVKGHVSFQSSPGIYTEVGAGITAAVDNIKQSSRNYLQKSRIDSVVGWQVDGGAATLVSDSSFGNVIEYSRPAGGGNFMRSFEIDISSLKNIDLIYFCIAKKVSDVATFNFGGWSETYNKLDSSSNYKDLGNGWRMYWVTFLAGSTICSGVPYFGLNSVGGTWRFHSFGVHKGVEPPADWVAAPEDLNAKIEENRGYADAIKTNLQNQIDGNIISWFRTVDPTMTNSPASDWTIAGDSVATEQTRNQHANDTYTNTVSGGCWRFQYNGSTSSWEWGVIADTATQKALVAAGKAQDTADGKRTTFGDTPFTPYKIGDLWAQGGSGELMKCNVERLTGLFNAGDWGKASKYTDDTAVNNLVVGGVNLLQNSSLEVISNSEFCMYADLAPIFDKYGLVEYTISFDIKAQVAGNLNVYQQNGSGARYGFEGVVSATTAYTRKSVTVTPYLNDGSIAQSMLAFYGTYGTGVKPSIKSVKVELGSKATVWTPAIADIDAGIISAQNAANTANTAIGLMSSDNDISPVEKISLKKEYQIILDEYSTIIAQASSFGVSSSTYTTAYNYVVSYIGANLDNLTTNWNLGTNGGTVLRNTFGYYYTQRTMLLNSISTAAKLAGSNAQTTANNAISAAATAQVAANTANTAISKISSDGWLSADEKPKVKLEWDTILAEYSLYITQSSSFGVSSAAYIDGFTVLSFYLNNGVTWVSGTPAWLVDLTTDTVIDGTVFRYKFNYYYTARTNLLNAIATKAKQAGIDAANNIVIGGRNLIFGTSGTQSGEAQYQYFNYPLSSKLTSGTYMLKFRYTCTPAGGATNPIGIRIGNAGSTYQSYVLTPVLSSSNDAYFYSPITLSRTSETHLMIWTNQWMNISELKVEEGTKYTTWTPAPEDTQKQIDDFSSDNILQPFEKQSLKVMFDAMAFEETQIENQMSSLGLNASNSSYSSLVSNWNNLSSYINPLLTDLTTQSQITGDTYRYKFYLYNESLSAVKDEIAYELKLRNDNTNAVIDGMVVGGENLISDSSFIEMTSDSNNDKYIPYAIGMLKTGKTYVFSCGSSDNDKYTGSRQYTIRVFGTTGGVWTNYLWQQIPLSSERQTFTFTIPLPPNGTPAASNMQFLLSGGVAGETAGIYSWWKEVSLQEGNRPTTWTPATKYLTDAMTFDVNGGLALGYIMAMRNQAGVVTSGINGIDVPNQTDIRMWAGATIENMQNAPFRVDEYGNITALSGKIGGFNVFGQSLISGSMEFTENAINALADLKAGQYVDIAYASYWESSLALASYPVGTHIYGQSQNIVLSSSGTLKFKIKLKASNGSCMCNWYIMSSSNIAIISGVDSVPTSVTYVTKTVELGAGTYYILADLSVNNTASTDAILSLQGVESSTVIRTSISSNKTKIGSDGFYSFMDIYNYFHFSHGGGLMFNGLIDVPSGLGGGMVSSNGTILNQWGLAYGASRVTGTITIKHNVTDTKFTVTVIPRNSFTWYFSAASAATSKTANDGVAGIVCSSNTAIFDFILLRTPY